VHLIAKAKIKTDAIDARVLAKLYAAGFLPEVWVPDAATLARRRQVTRRRQLVRQRVRLKSIIQSILHANLAPQCPFADLLGGKGRSWLNAQYLPDDEQEAVERHVEEYDRLTEALKGVERDIARAALADPDVKRLMTIPDIDMIVAVGGDGGDRQDQQVRQPRQARRLYRPQSQRSSIRPAHGGTP